MNFPCTLSVQVGEIPTEKPAGAQRGPRQDQAEGVGEDHDDQESEIEEPCDSNRGIDLEEDRTEKEFQY